MLCTFANTKSLTQMHLASQKIQTKLFLLMFYMRLVTVLCTLIFERNNPEDPTFLNVNLEFIKKIPFAQIKWRSEHFNFSHFVV